MKRIRMAGVTKSFKNAAAASRPKGKYVLKLYIAGATERSRRALEHARSLVNGALEGRCVLEVIDVYQQPILARDGQIIATPTLVRDFPLPVRRFIGTLESSEKMFIGLDLQTRVSTKR